MARITVEDCLTKVPDRFDLVLVAARRARMLTYGMATPMIEVEEGEKPAITALREIAAGLVGREILLEPEPRVEDSSPEFQQKHGISLIRRRGLNRQEEGFLDGGYQPAGNGVL